jgi:hypothetical protein
MNKELSKVRTYPWPDKSPINESVHISRLLVIVTMMNHKLNQIVGKLTTFIRHKKGDQQVVQSGLLKGKQIESVHAIDSITNQNIEQPSDNEKGHLVTIYKDNKYRLLTRKETMFLLSFSTMSFQQMAN